MSLVLVTGASRGIGRAIVERFAREGWSVIACARGQDGLDALRDAEAVRRRLGVLPDARGVYKRLTARENIEYFGQLHGLPAPEIARRTSALIEALGMQDVAER